MRYYIVTTTKYADECITLLTYGATQSNWLANLSIGDMVFLSQFNYKSQKLFGPFQVITKLFYDKKVIFPQQRFFYRIRFKPIDTVKVIDETDIYLRGAQLDDINSCFRIISLLQQNKHLHCICLTDDEGKAILNTFGKSDLVYKNVEENDFPDALVDVNCEYIWRKSKLDRKLSFASESDLESYLVLSLKDPKSMVFESLNKTINKYPGNNLEYSEIYNQFIFGNAYPADIVILNKENINVFELKKEILSKNILPQIEKEIKKHLIYSLYSPRINSSEAKKFNFYLVFLKGNTNNQFKNIIAQGFKNLSEKIKDTRESAITFLEYSAKNGFLSFDEL